MSKGESNFISFTGLERVKVTVTYYTSESYSLHRQSFEHSLKEIEADMNQMRGADNALHPNWQYLGPADLDNFLSQMILSLSRNPLLHVPEGEGEDELERVTRRVVIPPSGIREVIVEGVYDEA